MRFAISLLLVVAAFPFSVAMAADGTLQLRFTLEGMPPKPKVLAAVNPCGAPGPVLDQSLLLGKKQEIQNIVVYMYIPPNGKVPESKAALSALAKEVNVDNKNCYFEPRISAMHLSQSLVVGNPDPVGHNVKGEFFANASFNDLIPAGGKETKNFPKRERVPMPLSCSIHAFMNAYVLVTDTPYFGITDSAGVVKISHIPPGKHTFNIWHEKAGFITTAKQQGKELTWKQGRIDVDVQGDLDLGEFLIPVDQMKK